MQMSGSFNSQQYEPNQGGGGGHPPAQKIPFTVTATSIVENKNKDGGMFVVELTSPIGTMVQRYNIWNQSPKAVEIAHGQLSALCRATGRFQIDWNNEGAALKGGQGLMDIGYQKGEEPDPAFPDRKGYTELKKVYDAAGNEPGKSGAAQPQTQPAQQAVNQSQTQQANGAWGQQLNPAPDAQQQPQGQQQPTMTDNRGQAWQPGGNAAPAGGANPPWGSRT